MDLYLADAETGRVKRRLTKATLTNNYESLRFINSAGSFSPDGRYFAIAVKHNDKDDDQGNNKDDGHGNNKDHGGQGGGMPGGIGGGGNGGGGNGGGPTAQASEPTVLLVLGTALIGAVVLRRRK